MVISEKVAAVLTAQPIKSFPVQPLQIIFKSSFNNLKSLSSSIFIITIFDKAIVIVAIAYGNWFTIVIAIDSVLLLELLTFVDCTF